MRLSIDAASRRLTAVLICATAAAALSCSPPGPEWSGSFRGLGQEPGWLVEVEPNGIRWSGDYGEMEFETGPPRMSEGSPGRVSWTAGTPDHQITVSTTDEVCHDSMSGQEFTHTVTVEVDGSTYTGCGRWQESPDGQ